jgi:hypothetical protein
LAFLALKILLGNIHYLPGVFFDSRPAAPVTQTSTDDQLAIKKMELEIEKIKLQIE